MAGSWAWTYHSTATAAVKSLPRPLPDFTATRRSRSTARSTSSCLCHNCTPRMSDANRTGPPSLSLARAAGAWNAGIAGWSRRAGGFGLVAMLRWLMLRWSMLRWLMLRWLMLRWLMLRWLMLRWLMLHWLLRQWLLRRPSRDAAPLL